MKLDPGTRVDRYEVEGPLGSGGMAVVYRVRHVELDTVHALKVINTDDDELRERLLREGRAQGRVRHPAVLAVTDLVDVDGFPGLVLEFVAGGRSLADLLRRGPPSLDEARRLGRALIEGVAAAHRQGLVHRDLKPSNVLIQTVDGVHLPKVADFGLAKVIADESAALTDSGMSLGTPAYMAPEQARDSRSVDHRADLWSLGAILYELVAGHRAFAGGSLPEIIASVVQGRFEPLPDTVPPELRGAIEAALVTEPEVRIQSADELLARWTGGEAGSTVQGAPAPGSSGPAEDPTLAFGDPDLHPTLDELLDGQATEHLVECASCRVDLSLYRSTFEEEPPTGPSPRAWAAMGALAGVPLGVGTLSVAFGSVRDIGIIGVFGPLILAVFAASTGATGWLAARQRGGRPVGSLRWMALPVALGLVGLVGAVMGMVQATAAVDTMPADRRAMAALWGTQVALTSSLAGWQLTGLTALLFAFAAAACRPLGSTPSTGRNPAVPLGVAAGAGTIVWLIEATAGIDRPASFLLFAVLAGAGGAIALSESWEHDVALRARVSVWVGGALAVLTTGMAVEVQDLRRLVIAATDSQGADLLSLGEQIVIRLTWPARWLAPWMAAIGLAVAAAARGRPRAPRVDTWGPLLVVWVGAMVIFLGASPAPRELADRIPRALDTVALDGLFSGLRIDPRPAGADRTLHGIGAVVEPGSTGLRLGDRIFAWNGQPLDTASLWASQLEDRRCSAPPTDGCLAPGAPVAVTLLRGEPPVLVPAELELR